MTDRMPFFLIGIEKGISCPSLEMKGEFPAKILRILHAGIHALATGRAVHMG